jgi:hypothetical protein
MSPASSPRTWTQERWDALAAEHRDDLPRLLASWEESSAWAKTASPNQLLARARRNNESGAARVMRSLLDDALTRRVLEVCPEFALIEDDALRRRYDQLDDYGQQRLLEQIQRDAVRDNERRDQTVAQLDAIAAFISGTEARDRLQEVARQLILGPKHLPGNLVAELLEVLAIRYGLPTAEVLSTVRGLAAEVKHV